MQALVDKLSLPSCVDSPLKIIDDAPPRVHPSMLSGLPNYQICGVDSWPGRDSERGGTQSVQGVDRHPGRPIQELHQQRNVQLDGRDRKAAQFGDARSCWP